MQPHPTTEDQEVARNLRPPPSEARREGPDIAPSHPRRRGFRPEPGYDRAMPTPLAQPLAAAAVDVVVAVMTASDVVAADDVVVNVVAEDGVAALLAEESKSAKVETEKKLIDLRLENAQLKRQIAVESIKILTAETDLAADLALVLNAELELAEKQFERLEQ